MIEIYGRPNCNWCVKAKELLNHNGINYKYYTVGEDIAISEVTEMFPGVRTVPIVAIEGKRIGGYEELKEHLKNNEGSNGFRDI